MEVLKKQQKVLCAAFTKAHTSFFSKVNSDAQVEDKVVIFQSLETKMTELDVVHETHNNMLFQEEGDEEAIAKELE